MQVVAKSVNETLLSTRVLPALVTLANDAEMSVRVATVAAFGSIVEHSTDKTVRLSYCPVCAFWCHFVKCWKWSLFMYIWSM